jgi:hypothetical protein
MNASAEFIPLSPRHLHGFSLAAAQIATVFSSSGSAIIAGRDDFVVFHDDGPVLPPQTG